MAIDMIHFKSKRQAAVQQLDKKVLERIDTRRKYELGDLVLEAGLGSELSSVLLGMLTEAKEKLAGKNGEELRRRWWSKGDKLRMQTKRQA